MESQNKELRNFLPGMIQIVGWLITVAFLVGSAYSLFATKEWVDDRIVNHQKRQDIDTQDIKQSLLRIEARLNEWQLRQIEAKK